MFKRIPVILFCLISLSLSAQINFTPYSRFGIGQTVYSNSVRNGAMGNLGISISDGTSLNRMNPAAWSAIRVTTFDFAGRVSYLNQKSSTSQSNFMTGSFEHAGFAFRTNKKIAFAAGLAPYSGTNYHFVVIDTLMDDTTKVPYQVDYQSKGGLNEFYIGAGATVFRKIRLGVSVPLLFGSTKYYWDTRFLASNFPGQYTTRKATVYGIAPRFGLQYEDSLKFRHKVDIVKLNEKKIEDLQTENKKLQNESQSLSSAKLKIAEADSALNAVRKSLEAERVVLQARLDSVRDDGASSDKDIDRAEEAVRKVNTKRKKMDQKIQRKKKKITEKERMVNKKKERAESDIRKLIQTNEDIGTDSAKRFRTDTARVLITIGAIADPGAKLTGFDKTTYRIISDTTYYTYNESSGQSIAIPFKGGFGLSMSQPGKWQVGVDVSRQNWGTFQYFTETYNLKPTLSLNVGGEYIREAFSPRFSRRIAWRAGGFYEQTNLELKGSRINNMGFTAGVGIPLFRPVRDVQDRAVQPRINLALVAGMQGTTQNGLLQEGYIMLKAGVNLGERWFFRRSLE